MQSLGLADAMFRQLRLHVANDAERAGNKGKVTKAAQGSRGVIKHGRRICGRKDAANDKAVKKRA